MRIQKITSQNRRDFSAVYECEHCGHTKTSYGYDDAYFHAEVIPKMTCDVCEKQAGETYVPNPTKYPEGKVI